MKPLTEQLVARVLRRTWQPVALTRELPEQAVRGFPLAGEPLVLARIDGRLLAARHACPHKGFDLARSRVCDGALQCAYHGWRFDATGACLDIPSLPHPPPATIAAAHLDTFAVQERYGIVWVRLAPDEIAPLPDIPEFADPAWSFMAAPPMPFASGFRREIENFLDMTHFAFAHRTTLGVAANPTMPAMQIRELPDGFAMDSEFPALATAHESPGKLQQPHHRHYRNFLPNFTIIRQTFADGDQRLLLHVPVPHGECSCTVFWALALSPGFRGPPLAEQIAFSTRVLEEDRLMCENQFPREVPLNPGRGGWGVLVTPGDTLANVFQRTFRQFLLTHADEAAADRP